MDAGHGPAQGATHLREAQVLQVCHQVDVLLSSTPVLSPLAKASLWPMSLGLISRSLSPEAGWMSVKGLPLWSSGWPPRCPPCHSPTSSWWPTSPGPRVSFPPGAHLTVLLRSPSAGKERLEGGAGRGGKTALFCSWILDKRTVCSGINYVEFTH